MRITQDLLIKFAKDHIAKRLRQPNDIVAIYLTGSVLTPEPLIGGTTDIDMVFVHKENPPVDREVLRVSYEISLDIQHHHQSFYTFHRRLRLNPWLGHALCSHGGFLYDNEHWMDFIQAGVSAQFNTPETIYARSQILADKARQQWFDLEDPQNLPFGTWTDQYFKTIGSAANALAVLSGPGLTTRRFLLDFPARAEAMDKLELAGELVRLIGNDQTVSETYQDWRPAWQEALASASRLPNCTPNLNIARKAYFLNSCDAMAESGVAHAAFWPMIETWRQAAQLLESEKVQQETWLAFLNTLGFSPDGKEEQISKLDHFIDQVEAILADWKTEYNL